MQTKEEKFKLVDKAICDLDKAFGKGTVVKLGDESSQQLVQKTSTGIMSLDYAIGGGLPKGRILEIYGPESSGKTTITLHMIAEIQKQGGVAAFVDMEHAFDPIYTKNIGIQIDELYFSQPDNGEQGLEVVENIVRSGGVDLVVLDSVAALVPKAEIDGEMGDSHMGLQARLMSQGLRKLTGIVSKNKCTVVFINQLRDKIGIVYGNPETTTGGKALKFYASIRMDVRRIESIKTGGNITANRVRVKVVKNKVAPPYKEAELTIAFGTGVSKEDDIVTLAENLGIIQKSGAWYSYKGDNIGQGSEKTKQYLLQHDDVMSEVKEKIVEKLYAA